MPWKRAHLTLGEKNELRRHGQSHPNLTRNQLAEWALAKYGKLPSASTVSSIMTTGAVPTPLNPNAKRAQLGKFPAMEAELFQAIAARAVSLGVGVKELVQGHDPMLDDTAIWESANRILRRTRNDGSCVQPTWARSFKRRHGLLPDQVVAVPVAPAGTATTEGHASTPTGRIRFKSADDILLLTQVVATKPWQVKCALDGWAEVASQLRRVVGFQLALPITAAACRDRTKLLSTHALTRNFDALRKPGSEEEFKEKLSLINRVLSLQGHPEAIEAARRESIRKMEGLLSFLQSED